VKLDMDIELYRFSGERTQFLLTPHEFDIELDEGRYCSTPLSRNALALGAEAAKCALDLKMPCDCALVRDLLAAAITGESTTVTLRIGQYDEMTGDWLQWPGTRWMGRVLGVEIVEDVARLRCESAQVSLKRIGLRRLYGKSCSHVLYSEACGAALRSMTAIVTEVQAGTVQLDRALPGGWLETAAGARHMIVSEEHGETARLSLLYPVAIAPETPVTLVAGCDHSLAVCSGRFGNLDNYGGFPFIPPKNPFDGTPVF
jgi:hypothetical protein